MRHRPSLLIALCAAALAAGCAPLRPPAATPAPPGGAALGRPLPAVEVATLDGTPVALPAALGGRPALVSLWATWCEACATEFEPLRRLHEGVGGRGGEVVGLSVGEPAEKVRAVVQERRLPWRQFVDPEFRFADALGQKQVPTTLVVNAAGEVAFVGGALDEAALAALRRELDRPR